MMSSEPLSRRQIARGLSRQHDGHRQRRFATLSALGPTATYRHLDPGFSARLAQILLMSAPSILFFFRRFFQRLFGSVFRNKKRLAEQQAQVHDTTSVPSSNSRCSQPAATRGGCSSPTSRSRLREGGVVLQPARRGRKPDQGGQQRRRVGGPSSRRFDMNRNQATRERTSHKDNLLIC
jgi:hypothetical protein